MALRSLITFAVVVAVQALAGCVMPAMPGKGGEAGADRTAWGRQAEAEARKKEFVRRQVESGTFGVAQLYPAGLPVVARQLPPLPPTSSVRIPVIQIEGRSISPQTTVYLASAAAAQGGRHTGCVYKPIMSDADIEACR